ncbi:sigma-54 interaction domain-containing protein [Sporosarcina ureilytica]|uniref:Sigma-54-dependent Fis family transcriptional regulator n=1 Tax=Sporosarcina ureilytica TaxID=298596 RepID=A0A1D8JHG4_9BACL|nr:sigma 54-interacting transcriptional regulator [Sporosarcina ureilytica]AOV08160.1 sigma-54-dependent Fis family transcriptional regulator [Sporosarcina ureilytica]
MMGTVDIFNHKLLDIIFESASYGTVIVDNNGKIQYMSENYCAFINMDREQVIGEYVVNLIENTRMHLVVQTGKSEIGDLQFLKGNFVIANRIPIFEHNKIIGAIGTIIFRDVNEWKEMNRHIQDRLADKNLFKTETENEGNSRYSLHDLIGESPKLIQVKELVEKVAGGKITVLIRGESGTGKEIIAQSIHRLSERSNKPFIKVNCASIPEQLLESELFGYEEGTFTGANKGGKKGKFQIADGGTIFLDEIGDMPQQMQSKLLRVLQEQEFEPIGASFPKKIDVRIIAATNRPLEDLIKEGRFREDLFYRINALQLFLPSLRERKEDIPILINHFIEKYSSEVGKRITTIDEKVYTMLRHYHWPGNIRELENVIEAGVYLAENGHLTIKCLPDYIQSYKTSNQPKSLKEMMEDHERTVIKKTLINVNYDREQAAKVLGIGNSTIYDKIRKYKLFH